MEWDLALEKRIRLTLTALIARYPVLEECGEAILTAYNICKVTFNHGGKILVCGNGGSAADAMHFSAELMKGFLKKRPLDAAVQTRLRQLVTPEPEWIDHLQGALPVLPLTVNSGLTTAVLNDQAGDLIFAQQVVGYGMPGDSLFAISTSGNSGNVLKAVWVAKAKQLATIGLTGRKGGQLQELCDTCIRVPADLAHQVQELQLPVYHTLALMLEETFFPA